MIEILKEVTDWGDHVISNGYYHVNRQTPMKHFSKSRRKFVKIGDYQEKGSLGGVAVQGSNGNTYYVADNKCSCPGFKFRGDCKHIKQLEVA